MVEASEEKVLNLFSSTCFFIKNVWAWAGLAGDIADVVIPFVGGIGETVKCCGAVKKADDVIDAAKQIKKSGSNSVGTYKIVYKSGKNYVGKGPFDRTIQSATQHMNDHEDKVKALLWAPASSTDNAFISEYFLQSLYGVGRKHEKTYNKIWSPGRTK